MGTGMGISRVRVRVTPTGPVGYPGSCLAAEPDTPSWQSLNLREKAPVSVKKRLTIMLNGEALLYVFSDDIGVKGVDSSDGDEIVNIHRKLTPP